MALYKENIMLISFINEIKHLPFDIDIMLEAKAKDEALFRLIRQLKYKTDYKIEGFFEYVVPPLEGFWWQKGVDGVDYTDKSTFNWISVIRLPDFVTKQDFEWAVETASKKKKLDCSAAEFLTIDEGLCVQIMHLGSYDSELVTVALMDEFLAENGYECYNFAGGFRLYSSIKNEELLSKQSYSCGMEK